MFNFLKAQISSLVASIADFLITVLAVECLRVPYVPAGITGNIGGGIINFLLGRHWVFSGGTLRARRQAFRYLMIWLGSLGLNAAGMYLLSGPMHINYVASKVVVAVVVGVCFNYFLQKNYVFN